MKKARRVKEQSESESDNSEGETPQPKQAKKLGKQGGQKTTKVDQKQESEGLDDEDSNEQAKQTAPLKKKEPQSLPKKKPVNKKQESSSSSSSEDERGVGDFIGDAVQGLVMQTVKNEVERKVGLPGVVDMALDGKRKVDEAVDMIDQRNKRMAQAQRTPQSDASEKEDNTPAKQVKPKYKTMVTPNSTDDRPKQATVGREAETASGEPREKLVEKENSDHDNSRNSKTKGGREVKPLNLGEVSSDSKNNSKPKARRNSESREGHQQNSREIGGRETGRLAPNNGKYVLIPEGYILSQPAHPGACFFHLVFKIVGVFCYMFLGLIVSSTLTNFLTVFGSIILDFWVCKNITGRILAGYRWWNDMDEDGEEVWFYESYDYELRFQPIDTNVFWWGMGLNTIFWSIMCVLKVISLNFLWGLLTVVAAMLNWMNFYAYYKCHRAHHAKLSGMMSNFNQMFNPLAGTQAENGRPPSKTKNAQETELQEEDGEPEEHARNIIREGPDKPKKKLFGLF